jgi:hypothetical protein
MHPVRSSILAVAALLLVTAPALAESKVSQCKRLRISEQKVASQMQTLMQQKGGDWPEQIGKMLKIFENGAKQTRAMQFEDVTIVGFQQRATEIFERFHDDAVDGYEAAVRRDKAGTQQAIQKINKLAEEGHALDKRMNKYCGFSR